MLRFLATRPRQCSYSGWSSRALAFSVAVLGLTLAISLAPAKADSPAKPKENPKPEDIELETRDGLQLQATYYGSIQGKDTVPIIMLHGWKGSRADLEGLALLMQARGHAVIVPDLRGHGASTKIKINGDLQNIDQATMRRGDFDAMVTEDLERIKQFLIEKNNAGELNIEKLCIVGSEMGAIVAVNWAIRDWHWPALPSGKQGQDVKALVLISPPMNFRGISIAGTLDKIPLTGDASVLIVVGDKNSTAMGETKRMYSKLNTFRPKLTTDAERADKQDLFLATLRGTTLQGVNILNDKTILPQLDGLVAQFIDLRLVKKKFPWAARKPPLGD